MFLVVRSLGACAVIAVTIGHACLTARSLARPLARPLCTALCRSRLVASAIVCTAMHPMHFAACCCIAPPTSMLPMYHVSTCDRTQPLPSPLFLSSSSSFFSRILHSYSPSFGILLLLLVPPKQLLLFSSLSSSCNFLRAPCDISLFLYLYILANKPYCFLLLLFTFHSVDRSLCFTLRAPLSDVRFFVSFPMLASSSSHFTSHLHLSFSIILHPLLRCLLSPSWHLQTLTYLLLCFLHPTLFLSRNHPVRYLI